MATKAFINIPNVTGDIEIISNTFNVYFNTTNIKCSNNVETGISGSYTNTLTPKLNYVWDSTPTCTMGGISQTVTKEENSYKINIANVTGDIIINGSCSSGDYISSIKQNGEKYLLKDNEARNQINDIINSSVDFSVENDTLVITVGAESLPTFTGTNLGGYVYGPYQFEQDMTFEQWVASAYNTDGWTINANNRVVLNGFAYLKLYSPNQFVVKTDLIQAINYEVWLDN